MWIYEAGHEVPYSEDAGRDLVTGGEVYRGSYATNGTAEATYMESFVTLPTSTSPASSA